MNTYIAKLENPVLEKPYIDIIESESEYDVCFQIFEQAIFEGVLKWNEINHSKMKAELLY